MFALLSVYTNVYIREIMKPNELRRKNWLKYKFDAGSLKYCQVEGIVEDDVYCKAGEVLFQQSISSFGPVPLTTTILERIGFRRTVFEDEDAYRLDIFVSTGRSLSAVAFPKSELEGVVLFNNGAPVGEMVYEYLHQFQNIFYDLTGNELEVDLSDAKSVRESFLS